MIINVDWNLIILRGIPSSKPSHQQESEQNSKGSRTNAKYDSDQFAQVNCGRGPKVYVYGGRTALLI